MKNFSITAIICQIIGAIACIAFGIFFVVTNDDISRIVIFFIAGGLCLINALRMFLKYRKEKKDEDEQNK